MTEIFSTIRLMAMLGGGLLLALLILLSLPQSRLKEIVQPFVSWAIAVFCIAYIASPLDFMPEIILGPGGVFDDLAALVVAITSARSAMNAGKVAKQLH